MKLSKKEITFNFFKENPKALYEDDIEEYLKLLGIKRVTYNKHRNEFISINIANICPKTNIISNQYERRREKFTFDDSKLFEMSSR